MNRLLAVRLEFVGATIIFLAAVLALVALITTGVDAGLVGFVLSYALNTTGSLVCFCAIRPWHRKADHLADYIELAGAVSQRGRDEHCQCRAHIALHRLGVRGAS